VSVARTLRIADLAISVFDGPFGSNLKSIDYTSSGNRVVRLENIGHRGFIYPVHARIRKSLGEMIRKLSDMSSQ